MNAVIGFPLFIIIWSTFFATAIICLIAGISSGQNQFSWLELVRQCRPNDWCWKSARVDLIINVSEKIYGRLHSWLSVFCTLAIASSIQSMVGWLLPDHIIIHPSTALIVFCIVTVIAISDFACYLSHVMQHRIPALWELHKVHHSATFLNPLTAKRVHPLSAIFDELAGGLLTGIPVGIFAVMFQLDIEDVIGLSAVATKLGFTITLQALQHSHFPIRLGVFDRVFVSPHMHQLHHSSKVEHWDRNFGSMLSIWDWMFGTVYQPSPGEALVYGLANAEHTDYRNLSGVYIGPLKKIGRLLVKESVALPPNGWTSDTVIKALPFWECDTIQHLHKERITSTQGLITSLPLDRVV